jgi:hypothetical protein
LKNLGFTVLLKGFSIFFLCLQCATETMAAEWCVLRVVFVTCSDFYFIDSLDHGNLRLFACSICRKQIKINWDLCAMSVWYMFAKNKQHFYVCGVEKVKENKPC